MTLIIWQQPCAKQREEIGIKPEEITVIGVLTNLYIPKSNFMVYPFVGYIKGTPKFVTDNTEVDTLLQDSQCLRDENRGNYHFSAGDIEIDALSAGKLESHNLWGYHDPIRVKSACIERLME